MRARRALFLSGSFGKGHDTLAEACATALEPRGIESRIVDCMPMLGPGLGQVGDWVFRTLLSSTPVYDAFHFSQLRDNGPLGRFVDRAAVKTLLPQLREEVRRYQPQLIVSVFATGASAAVHLRDEHPALALAVFITDSFAHGMWVHEGTDLFLVTSDMAAASVRRYWPAARVEVVNAPVRTAFYEAPSRDAAKAAFGVPQDAPCVLLMSGAWGIGPLDAVARALARAGRWVLVVGGSNTRLAQRLAAVAREHPSVIPFGYTDRIPELMAASDVIVTSSGDTCREARVVGRPLVLLDVVPGHGRENLMHELELGDATVCSPTEASVLGAVEIMLAAAPAAPERVAPGPAVPGPAAASATDWNEAFVDTLARAGLPV